MEARAKRLQQLSVEEIEKELGKPHLVAERLKTALEYYDKLSVSSKTNAEIAQSIGKDCPLSFVTNNRSYLIQNNLLKPRKGRKPRVGDVKKLARLTSCGITYRPINLNVVDLEAANLDSNGKYFCVAIPGNQEFTLKFSKTRKEAATYAKKL